MDVVQPKTPLAEENPVVVMTFGGNFIRGGRNDVYSIAGAQTTTMRDYCRHFAEVGYTCVAIDYRLSGEEPVPSNIGYSDDILIEEQFQLKDLHQRHNMIRELNGLEPLAYDSPVLRNTIISAAEDLYKAIAHLQDNADDYNIDPNRIAIGGFSAGAMTSFNVAYGMNAPVKAVIANSSMGLGFDVDKASINSENLPPAMLSMGQYDLDPLIQMAQHNIPAFEKLGIEIESHWVPGFGHFYPAGAITLGSDVSRQPLLERMITFLNKNL
jgi:dienelactone hydrolase